MCVCVCVCVWVRVCMCVFVPEFALFVVAFVNLSLLEFFSVCVCECVCLFVWRVWSCAHLAELLDVVSVDDDGVEAKGLEPLLVGLHVVLQRRRLRLTKPEKKNCPKI